MSDPPPQTPAAPAASATPAPAAAATSEPTPAGPAQPAAADTGILPPEYWAQHAPVELDPAEEQDETDSAFGSNASATTSITSTILQYRNLHGRTYHSDQGTAQYWGANDEQQIESMDFNHHVLTLCMDGKLYLAPLEKEKVQRVLDIGTGTGIWAIDFADEFPNAQVTGTDVSPIQPSWVPPNLQFEIEDCTQDWTFPPNSADYIHMRWLVGSIADWPALFRQAYETLKPGGYLESYEAMPQMESDDGSITEGTAMKQWGKFFVEGGKKIGRSFTVVDDGTQRKAMEEVGFEAIEEWNFKAPIGGWPKDPKMKEIGVYAEATLLQDIEGYVLFMANVMGWKKNEISVYIAHLRRELRSKKFHPLYRQKVVWGRKPAAA